MTLHQPMWLRCEEVPELPPDWVAVSTSDACTQLRPGKLYDTKTTTATGKVPVLNQSSDGYMGYHNDQPGVHASHCKPVVTFANHTCAVRLMKEPFSCIQNIFPKIGKPDVCDTIYFYYAAQGRVDLADYKGHHPLFRQAYIPVPPLPTQRKIAAILSAYDDLIENNTRRIAILEEMARLIYREWFVHFRFPGHEDVEMVGSELGPIPGGWRVARLGDALELAYGRGLRKADRTPGPFPVYGSSGVIDHHHSALVDGPGIIVGRKGNVGSVYWSDSDFYPIDTVFYVVSGVPLRYLYYNLQGQPFVNTDTAVPGLKRSHAYLLPLVLPSDAILRMFDSLIDQLFQAASNLHSRAEVLRRTRDLLLPRLVSGEIDVSDLPIDTGGLEA